MGSRPVLSPSVDPRTRDSTMQPRRFCGSFSPPEIMGGSCSLIGIPGTIIRMAVGV